MPSNLSRRDLLQLGTAAPASFATWTSHSRSRRNQTTISGTVKHIDGTPSSRAEVFAVSAAIRDEPKREGFADYQSDADRVDLPIAHTRTDETGAYSLDVSDIPTPHRICALWHDPDAVTWFSPLSTDPETLTLTNQLLFDPQKAQVSTYGANTDHPVPRYGGTVTAWRWINPANPQEQHIRLGITETASGNFRDPSDLDYTPIHPWELTIDREPGRYESTNALEQYSHPPISNALVSLTVPERINDKDLTVAYDDITVYEATEALGRTTNEPVREAFTHWHPLRTPRGIPAFTEGGARDYYTSVDLESRLRNEDEANKWLSIIGTLGSAAISAISGGAGTALTGASVAIASFDEITISTGSTPGNPQTILGTKIEEEMRPSKNTHDVIDRLWVDPPANLNPVDFRAVPAAVSVVVSIPILMPKTNATGEFFLEAVWEASETAGFGQRIDLDPAKHVMEVGDDTPSDSEQADTDDQNILPDTLPWSTGWPMFQFDPQNTGFTPAGELAEGSLQPIWKFEHGVSSIFLHSVAVAEDTVFIQHNNQLSALNWRDGSVRWTTQTRSTFSPAPAVVGDRVYTGGECLKVSDGTSVFEYAVSGYQTVFQDRIYIANLDGVLASLDRESGEKLWERTPTDMNNTPAVTENGVFVGGFDNQLHAFDPAEGTELWAFETGDSIRDSAVVADGLVYVGSDDGYLYAIRADDGSQVWRKSVGVTYYSPAVAGGRVFTGQYALDSTTGNILWEAEPNVGGHNPTVTQNSVFVFGTTNDISKLYRLSRDDGAVQDSVEIEGADGNPPVVVKDVMYVSVESGFVHAFTSV